MPGARLATAGFVSASWTEAVEPRRPTEPLGATQPSGPSHAARTASATRVPGNRMDLGSVEDRVDETGREADDVAIGAVVRLLVTVERLEAEREPLVVLEDHVRRRVDRLVIRVARLARRVVDVDVAAAHRRPPTLRPVVRVAEHEAEIRDRLEIPVMIEAGVVVEEVVVAVAEEPVAVRRLRLQAVVVPGVEHARRVEAPAELALPAPVRVVDADRAQNVRELDVADALPLPARVHAAVGRVVDALGLVGLTGEIDLGLGLLEAEVELPLLAERQQVPDERPAREDRRVRPFVVDGVRPDVGILEDTEGLPDDDVVVLPPELADAVRELAAARAVEVVLVVEARRAGDLGRPDVDPELRALGVDVEARVAALVRLVP